LRSTAAIQAFHQLLVETKKRLRGEPLSIKFIREVLNQDSPQAESTHVIRPHPGVLRFHDFDADLALGQRSGCSRAQGETKDQG